MGNQDRRLVIPDWYTKGLDTVDNPDICNDDDWVKKIFHNLEKLEDKYST